MPAPIFKAIAFVDWNAQIHGARPGRAQDQRHIAATTLSYVGKTLGRVLSREAPSVRFQVTLRLYHGWCKGYEKTDRRKAVVSIIAGADFLALSQKTSVGIRPVVEYGDHLYSAVPSRFHPHIECHLPNTLRNRTDDPAKFEEKMVDTAIASDFVDIAHREPDTWLILMAEDDDLVPPILTAEGARFGKAGKVLLVRRRAISQYLKLEGLSVCP